MTPELAELLDLLRLDEAGDGALIGRCAAWRNVYGGQMIAQGLAAAGRHAGGVPAQSLHAYFVRAGDPAMPIRYRVREIRRGRYEVEGWQNGQAVVTMLAAFKPHEAGAEYQPPMPDAPDPEGLPTVTAVPHAIRRNWLESYPIEIRPADLDTLLAGRSPDGRQRTFLRAPAALPDDPWLHQLLIAYASDLVIFDTALLAVGVRSLSGEVQAASLDHAVWFHRPARIDDWLYYDQRALNASDARGLNSGALYDRTGRLVASVAQEVLMRPAKRRPEG